jgi:hypothetical protein
VRDAREPKEKEASISPPIEKMPYRRLGAFPETLQTKSSVGGRKGDRGLGKGEKLRGVNPCGFPLSQKVLLMEKVIGFWTGNR